MPHAPTDSFFDDIGPGLDAGLVAEAAIEFACHLAGAYGLDEGDCLTLVAAEATAMSAAYGKASLQRTLAFLHSFAPARAAVLAGRTIWAKCPRRLTDRRRRRVRGRSVEPGELDPHLPIPAKPTAGQTFRAGLSSVRVSAGN